MIYLKRFFRNILQAFVDDPFDFLFVGFLWAMMFIILLIGLLAGLGKIDLDTAIDGKTEAQEFIEWRNELVQECLKLETYTREECILMIGNNP